MSSAYDLTLIARSGMQNADFRRYASTVRAAFPGEERPGKKRGTFEIQNTNRLLTGAGDLQPYKGIAGVKNGTTTHAGSTFTGVAERGGRVLLVTVMNPSSKEPFAVYKETQRLFDWGFAAAGKVKPVGQLVPPKSARPQEPPGGRSRTGHGRGRRGRGAADRASRASSGAGVALAVLGGVLVALAAVVLIVNRWLHAPEDPEEDRAARPSGAPAADPARDPAAGRGSGAGRPEQVADPAGSRSGDLLASRPPGSPGPPAGQGPSPPPPPALPSVRAPVAVHAAHSSSSFAMKLIHSSSATGTPNAPYIDLPCDAPHVAPSGSFGSSNPTAPISAATTRSRRGGSTPGSSVSR